MRDNMGKRYEAIVRTIEQQRLHDEMELENEIKIEVDCKYDSICKNFLKSQCEFCVRNKHHDIYQDYFEREE